MNFTLLMATPVLLTTLPLVGALVPPPFNLIISNVPGPRDKLYLHGAEMEAYYPVSQVGHGQALNITVLSYAGQLAFGFVSCRDSVPHMQRLAVYMGEAIEELESTFLGKAATGKSKSARVAKQRKKPAGKARKKSAKRKAAPRNKRSGERTAGKPAAKKAKRGSR
jgi:hypothetical protein